MKPINKGMLVRGKIVVGSGQGSLVSESNESCIVAVTHWFRHDDNLSKLEKELQLLSNVYMNMSKTSALMTTYEYKEYK